METERPADEFFGLLSDETRLDILRSVARAQHERKQTGVASLSFSDIYDRVEVDNTSKLSYHLGELTGTFLRKHEAGYAFTHAGEQMARRRSEGSVSVRPRHLPFSEMGPDHDPVEVSVFARYIGHRTSSTIAPPTGRSRIRVLT